MILSFLVAKYKIQLYHLINNIFKYLYTNPEQFIIDIKLRRKENVNPSDCSVFSVSNQIVNSYTNNRQ